MLGFQGKASRLLFIFFFFYFSFFFFFSFSFGRLHWSSFTGNTNLLWVVNRSKAALQSEKRYIASQPIGTIWCAVCELAKGGMFKVEYAGTSIDQKLNHAWNCSIIKVTYMASIFQLRARVETQKCRNKNNLQKCSKL